MLARSLLHRLAVSMAVFLAITTADARAGNAGYLFLGDQSIREASEETSDSFLLTLWRVVRRWIVPDALDTVYRLRTIIASEKFEQQCAGLTPPQRVDKMYEEARRETEGDPAAALFTCAVATFPYHTFDAVIPFVKWVVTIPVSTEFKDEYQRRIDHIPGGIFPDSPTNGDRDKLTHFFGSAFLMLQLKQMQNVRGLGEVIELFEATFKLEGAEDRRDEKVNALGAEFGRRLLLHENVLPSMFLRDSLGTEPRETR